MTAEINGHSFAASLTCESYESMSLAFTAPPAFSYFSVRTEGTGYAMDVGGVPDETAAEELNGGAPLRLLFDTIKTAVFTNHGAFVRDKENGVYAAGLTVNGSPVSVVFDAEGYLRSLTAPGLTAAFSRTESHVDA